MKRLFAVAVGSLICASLFSTVYAAPAASSAKAKQLQGLKNAKKVMQARISREKKMAEVRKKAVAKKHLAEARH